MGGIAPFQLLFLTKCLIPVQTISLEKLLVSGIYFLENLAKFISMVCYKIYRYYIHITLPPPPHTHTHKYHHHAHHHHHHHAHHHHHHHLPVLHHTTCFGPTHYISAKLPPPPPQNQQTINLVSAHYFFFIYSRASMARTLMARIPRLFRTRS